MDELVEKCLELIIDQEDDETLAVLSDGVADAIERQDCINERTDAEGLATLAVYSYFTDYLVKHDEEILAKAIPIISEEAKKQVYHDIHTDLMSITCRDSYESMSKRVDQLLNKVQEKMLAPSGVEE